jgi:hypothetical protein
MNILFVDVILLVVIDMNLSKAQIYGKTYKYEKRFQKPDGTHRDAFSFVFNVDGTFVYEVAHDVLATPPPSTVSVVEF